MSAQPTGTVGGSGSDSLNIDPHDRYKTEENAPGHTWDQKGDIVQGTLRGGAGSAGTSTGDYHNVAHNVTNPNDYVEK